MNGNLPLPSLPKTTAPTLPKDAVNGGGIVMNNPVFNLKGIENPRELWKQLMAEAKKLTPTAVPFSQ